MFSEWYQLFVIPIKHQCILEGRKSSESVWHGFERYFILNEIAAFLPHSMGSNKLFKVLALNHESFFNLAVDHALYNQVKTSRNDDICYHRKEDIVKICA